MKKEKTEKEKKEKRQQPLEEHKTKRRQLLDSDARQQSRTCGGPAPRGGRAACRATATTSLATLPRKIQEDCTSTPRRIHGLPACIPKAALQFETTDRKKKGLAMQCDIRDVPIPPGTFWRRCPHILSWGSAPSRHVDPPPAALSPSEVSPGRGAPRREGDSPSNAASLLSIGGAVSAKLRTAQATSSRRRQQRGPQRKLWTKGPRRMLASDTTADEQDEAAQALAEDAAEAPVTEAAAQHILSPERKARRRSWEEKDRIDDLFASFQDDVSESDDVADNGISKLNYFEMCKDSLALRPQRMDPLHARTDWKKAQEAGQATFYCLLCVSMGCFTVWFVMLQALYGLCYDQHIS